MKLTQTLKLLTVMVALLAVSACSSAPAETIPAPVQPAPTSTPAPAATATPTPTAAATAAPTATPTPRPTATPTPIPTPVPTVAKIEGFTYDKFGFTLRLDNETTITDLGWTETAADKDQGLLSFDYSGTNVLVLWVSAAGEQAMLSDAYTILQTVEPDLTFTAISEGIIEVANGSGIFGGFVLTDQAGASAGGGLIGAWVCPQTKTGMALTIISANATTLQVRFNRVLQGVECG